MKLGEVLKTAIAKLRLNRVEDPAIEAAVLLGHATGLGRSQLYAQPERALTRDEVAVFTSMVERRVQGEPSAYIVQSKEFYGLSLYVDRRVLIPRPETETLVEAVLQHIALSCRPPDFTWKIADIGTGSGAIALALAGHIQNCHIYGIDVSAPALEVADLNIRRYGLDRKISLLQGSLLAQLAENVDIIVANLPYIGDTDRRGLQREIRDYEPSQALSGGVSGTELIEELILQAKGKLLPGGAVFLEVGQGQAGEVSGHARAVFAGANVSAASDHSGIQRVISIVN